MDTHFLIAISGMVLIVPAGFVLLYLWFRFIGSFLFGRHRSY